MDHQTTHRSPDSASLRLRDFAAELFAAFEAKVPGKRLVKCQGKCRHPVCFSWRDADFMVISWGCIGC